MHIVCSKEDLVNNTNLVLKAISSRTPLPILECILLEVVEDKFTMQGNDLSMAIETNHIEATIVESGNIAIDAKIFWDIIRKLPENESVVIKVENNQVYIKGGKAEFKITGQNPEEFPTIPSIEKNEKYQISAVNLRNMIRQTIFSIATTEEKPHFTGELIDIDDNSINLVAVDNFRVSLRSLNLDKKVENIRAIVPGKALNELSKILSSNDEATVSIYFADKHILFETEDCIVVSRLLEGEFLKYKQIFNDEHSTIFYVDRQILLLALERASLMSTELKKSPVKFKIESDRLEIMSIAEAGMFNDEIDIEMEGNQLEISFNPRYLIEAIKSIDIDKVSLQFTTPLSPCTVKGMDTEDYKYLILPLRIS